MERVFVCNVASEDTPPDMRPLVAPVMNYGASPYDDDDMPIVNGARPLSLAPTMNDAARYEPPSPDGSMRPLVARPLFGPANR